MVKVWRLDSGRAAEWREIRLASLRDAPEAFDATFSEWRDRPLADFAIRLETVPTFAAGDEVGRALAVASWQTGLDPRDAGRGWLLSVFARPEARGRGYAEAAIRAALRDAAVAGMGSVGLHVLATNRAAQSLYRRIGFRDSGRGGVTNSRGEPEAEMILPLEDKTISSAF